MLAEFLNRLLELKRPELVGANGRTYSTHNLNPVREPEPEGITVHTLSGLAAYLQEHADDLPDRSKLMLVVESPTKVKVLSHWDGPFAQRRLCAVATMIPEEFPFGKYLPQEEFIVAMMTRFVRTKLVEDILAVAGNLTTEGGVRVEDDGYTQVVTTRAGVARNSQVVVDNPVVLQPFRTFAEAEQPECPLVLRFRKDKEDAKPTCALFEADGGLWKVKAAENIATWLKQALPGYSVLA